ncbi:MAG: hypothetical protein J7K61_02405 [Thermoplasmata archaeon]|nr:hypothetical protein [Thermoplasmata archaeon]
MIDKLSGASEIEKRFVEELMEGKSKLFDIAYKWISSYPSMAPMWNISNITFIYREKKKIAEKIDEFHKEGEYILKEAIKVIEGKKVITYSRSSSVIRLLKEKKFNVICSEGRPNYEGRSMAAELNATLVIDAALPSFIPSADFVIVGADAIVKSGFVNKVGTKTLAVIATHYDKPFYVIASPSKIFPFVMLKYEDKKEIWEYDKAINFYFELIPHEYVTEYFVSKNGNLKYDEKIAGEIYEIRDRLKEDGYKLME